MKHTKMVLAFLGLLGIICPPVLRAEAASPPEVTPRQIFHDVRLGGGGELVAQVISRNGQLQAGQTVVLVKDGQAIATGLSNEQGRVTFAGLNGGPCQLKINEQITALRLWTAPAAPPVAVDELLVVSDENVQRAQQSLCHLCGEEPLMIGLLIAAAIAIPIAVHQSGS